MEELTIFIICIILLAIQLLLCFKVKNLVIRLIPAILVLLAFVVSMILLRTSTGWDGLLYIAFVFLSGILFIPCVAGWVIWAVYNLITKRNK